MKKETQDNLPDVTLSREPFMVEEVHFEDDSKELYSTAEIYSIAEKYYCIQPNAQNENITRTRKSALTHIRRNLKHCEIPVESNVGKKGKTNITLYYPKEEVRKYIQSNAKHFLNVRERMQEEALKNNKELLVKRIPDNYYNRIQIAKKKILSTLDSVNEEDYIDDDYNDPVKRKEKLINSVVWGIISDYIQNYVLDIDIDSISRDYDIVFNESKGESLTEFDYYAGMRLIQANSYWKLKDNKEENSQEK